MIDYFLSSYRRRNSASGKRGGTACYYSGFPVFSRLSREIRNRPPLPPPPPLCCPLPPSPPPPPPVAEVSAIKCDIHAGDVYATHASALFAEFRDACSEIMRESKIHSPSGCGPTPVHRAPNVYTYVGHGRPCLREATVVFDEIRKLGKKVPFQVSCA